MRIGYTALAASVIAASIPDMAIARDNDPGAPDVITLCYAATEVCLDACDKAVLTGTEFAACERKCNSTLDACLKGASRTTTTAVKPGKSVVKSRSGN
jgi:phosphotransacetylase